MCSGRLAFKNILVNTAFSEALFLKSEPEDYLLFKNRFVFLNTKYMFIVDYLENRNS